MNTSNLDDVKQGLNAMHKTYGERFSDWANENFTRYEADSKRSAALMGAAGLTALAAGVAATSPVVVGAAVATGFVAVGKHVVDRYRANSAFERNSSNEKAFDRFEAGREAGSDSQKASPQIDAVPKVADTSAAVETRPLAPNNIQDGKPVDPKVSFAPSEERRERDFARELAERVAKDAADPQPKSEAEAVRGIEQRAALHESSYLAAKQPALDALPKEAEGTAKIADRLAELRKRDVETVSPEVARQWAEVDARDFAKLQDPTKREDAAVAVAENARNSAAYSAALTVRAPDVVAEVEAIDKANSERSAAKDERKNRTDEPTTIDPVQLERVAQARAADSKQAAQELGLNGIEPSIEREQQKLEGDAETKRNAWLKKGQEAQADQPKGQAAAALSNKVESDEVFTATNSDVKLTVPPEIEQKYLRVGDKFYHPKNTDVVAFEDKGNKLETRSNSEQVAESMVSIARARGWDEIKVSGSETFRKEVWLEAAAQGMHVKGYTPTEQDKADLTKRTRDADINKVEPDKAFRGRENEASPAAPKEGVSPPQAGENVRPATEIRTAAQVLERRERAQAFMQKPAAEVVQIHPELAGAYSAVSAVEKQTSADNLTPQQKAVVMSRVRQNVVNSIERGELPEVKMRETTEVQRERKDDREVSR